MRCSGARGGEEKGEVKVQFSDLPAAVQKTFTVAAEGQTITQVDKETDEGPMCYEADVKLHGQNYEIRVAQDGKLISKKVDSEDQQGEHEDKGNDEREKD